MLRPVVVVLVGLMLVPITLMAEPGTDRPVVQVAMMHFPGYSEQNEQGEASGTTVELTRLILERAGYQSNIRILPSARIWRGLQDGDVHLWPGIVDKPGLEDKTLLTSGDLAQVAINLYYPPGAPTPVWPQSVRGQRMILITNYTYTEALLATLQDPGMQVSFDSSISHAGAVSMLLRGRGDFLLDYRVQVDPIVAAMGLAPLPYIQVAEHPMRFVLSLQSGYAEQLKADIDIAYDVLAAEGEVLDIAERFRNERRREAGKSQGPD